MRPIRQMTLRDGFDVSCMLDAVKPHHELVECDLHDISRRIREYDPTYFLMRNNRTGKVEVHNTENLGNTYCFTNPFDELDARLLERVRETDIQRIGAKARMMQMLEEERLAEEADKRQTRNMAEGLAQETHYHWREAFKLM